MEQRDPGSLGFTFREEATPEPSTLPTAPRPAPPPRRRRSVAAVVASLVAVAAIGVAGWLWYVADTWQQEATDLRSQAAQARGDAAVLEAERDSARTQLEQTTTELAETTRELDSVNARIDELAAEKAQAADQQVVATQLAQQASQVASGLERCTDGQTQLIGYVTAPAGTYDPAQVVAFAQQVQEACSAARAANDQLSAIVARLGG